MPNTTSLPVAIIGAGPIGLAAAAMCKDLFQRLCAHGGPEQKVIIFCTRDLHSVVFGGFASGSLASRIEDADVDRQGLVEEVFLEIGRAHV